MGRWCSSVIAQSGAGRGKLPKAILYPWIPPHNLPPGNSVNSSTCSVSDLRQCQATTDLTLLAPPRSFWKIPIPDFQIVAIFITSDQVFSARAGVWKHEEQIRGSVWKQIWGTAARWAMTALVLSRLFSSSRLCGLFRPLQQRWQRSPPGASGALPRSGHCCSLASPDPATMVAATRRQRRYTAVTLYILTTQH